MLDTARSTLLVALIAILGMAGTLALRPLLPPGTRWRGRATSLLLIFAILMAVASALAEEAPAGGLDVGLRLVATVLLICGLVGAVGMLLFDVVLYRFGIEMPSILRDLAQAAVAGAVALAALRMGGLDVLPLLTTSAVLTAVIGFALQATIANVFGGLALQVDRTVSGGDWIQVGPHIGRVQEVGWRSTRIVTKDGDTVFVPNGQLVVGEVLNFSRPTFLHRMWVRVGIDYRHPPGVVRPALLRAVHHVPGILTEPPADCVITDFGDSAVLYAVRFWVDDYARTVEVENEVRARIYYAARRAGLGIPFPIRTLVFPTDGAPRDAGAEELAERRALLKHIDLFTPLDTTSMDVLAAGLQQHEFAAGEPIIRQDEPGDSLFLVRRGQVGVLLGVDGVTREIAVHGPGNFFGEMSLMTGAPRTATCIARTEVSCYVVDAATFRRVLAARPEIADQLSQVLAQRQMELEAERGDLSAEARARRLAEQHTRLLGRIREFFSLS